MKSFYLLKIAGLAVLFLVINVAFSFVVVAVYSHMINPGHDAAFYEAFAQRAAPWSSIFFGMPLMFFFCWRLCRKLDLEMARTSALGLWAIYTIIDFAIIFSVGVDTKLGILVAISTITKLVAAWFGANAGAKSGEARQGAGVVREVV